MLVLKVAMKPERQAENLKQMLVAKAIFPYNITK
jgi:hypothetical protein